MGLAKLRSAITTFVWYHLFYSAVLISFFIGLELQQCSIFWVDRLYILFAIPAITALCVAVAPGNWWGRFFHGFLTLAIMIFFLVIFFAYLLPLFVTANCQPDGNNVPDVCSGGRCNNPFNDLRWSCLYGNTSEGQLCTYDCVGDLCNTGVSPQELTTRFGHTWIFAYVIVFVVLTLLSLLLLWNLNKLVARARQELAMGLDERGSIGEELRMLSNPLPYFPGSDQYEDSSQPHAHGNGYMETNHDSYLENRPNLLRDPEPKKVGDLLGLGTSRKRSTKNK